MIINILKDIFLFFFQENSNNPSNVNQFYIYSTKMLNSNVAKIHILQNDHLWHFQDNPFNFINSNFSQKTETPIQDFFRVYLYILHKTIHQNFHKRYLNKILK